MREQPPPQLIALLERLGLATAGQVGRRGRRVRRLARDLPRFESVWVDALSQARVLTPYQAAEINAGRGESLRVGPYVLYGSLRWPDYLASYRARRIGSRQMVRLAVVESTGERADAILSRFESLVAASKELQCEHLAPLTDVGIDGDRIWAASRWVEGRTAAEWMVHSGRLPPEVVLEIARAMLVGLVELETAGLCHGDLGASGLTLSGAGRVALLQPGVRTILRPEEGYGHADLRPEAYDYLAPERVTCGTPPTPATDIYACGCLWWHLLCGRPPLSGGDSLAKLRSAEAANVVEVRRFAPEIPAPLAAAISACLDPQPSGRPESMARLAAMLGSPMRRGKLLLTRYLAQSGRPAARWPMSARASRKSGRTSLRLAALAGCLAAAAVVLWPVWRVGLPSQGGHQENSARKPPHTDLTRDDSPAREGGVLRTTENRKEPRPSGRGYRGTAGTSLKNPVVPADYEAERPTVVVPRGGLVVDAEDVHYENIDFLYDHPPDRQAALVHLRCARAQFRGCSFRSSHTTSTPPVAIRWTGPAEPSDSALSLPSGRVLLSNCVLHGVATGVDCRMVGALAVELVNTLHLGGGPLVRLDHCPKPDEPVLIALTQVTLRGTGPLLECRYEAFEQQPGQISIRAARCAFAPRPDTPLLLLSGPESPERLLRNIRWTGQGSLVLPETPIAAWRGTEGEQQMLDDTSVSIEGLVRSEVSFAGDAESGPAASRVVRWQAPLRSAKPPGIDPAPLRQRNASAVRASTAAGLTNSERDVNF